MAADGSDYQLSLQVCNENDSGVRRRGAKNLRTYGPVGISAPSQKSEGATEASLHLAGQPEWAPWSPVNFGGRAENIGPGDGTVNAPALGRPATTSP